MFWDQIMFSSPTLIRSSSRLTVSAWVSPSSTPACLKLGLVLFQGWMGDVDKLRIKLYQPSTKLMLKLKLSLAKSWANARVKLHPQVHFSPCYIIWVRFQISKKKSVRCWTKAMCPKEWAQQVWVQKNVWSQIIFRSIQI